jgi:hypothetical protein
LTEAIRGCEQVATHLSAEGIDRVLLLSDGLANAGPLRERKRGALT